MNDIHKKLRNVAQAAVVASLYLQQIIILVPGLIDATVFWIGPNDGVY